MGEIAIEPEGNLAEEKIADRIDAVAVDEHVWFHHVLQALAHLLTFYRPPAVSENLFRQGQSRSHQECRPVDGVKAEDILADELNICGPVRAEGS